MPTTNEYTLFAANAYARSPEVVSPTNEIPIPGGWRDMTASITSGNRGVNGATGFLARAYKHDLTGEIVIAYGGTTTENSLDWTNGNLPAALGFNQRRARRMRFILVP